MTIYSIEKVGSDYVVKADDQGLIKVSSRRRAAQLVLEASGLLDETGSHASRRMAANVGLAMPDAAAAAPAVSDIAPNAAPSIARERGEGA